jgi:hypothetical protein
MLRAAPEASEEGVVSYAFDTMARVLARDLEAYVREHEAP